MLVTSQEDLTADAKRSIETMIVGVILAAILTRMKISDIAMKNAKRVRTSSYSLELGSASIPSWEV